MKSKAKCEKCKQCKVITQYDVVVCDYLSEFHKEAKIQVFCRPLYCSGFRRKKKGKHHDR